MTSSVPCLSSKGYFLLSTRRWYRHFYVFHLAEWQALAKLRIHTDDTLALLDQAFRQLGMQVRKFQRVTCVAFQTQELSEETARRLRRELANI